MLDFTKCFMSYKTVIIKKKKKLWKRIHWRTIYNIRLVKKDLFGEKIKKLFKILSIVGTFRTQVIKNINHIYVGFKLGSLILCICFEKGMVISQCMYFFPVLMALTLTREFELFFNLYHKSWRGQTTRWSATFSDIFLKVFEKC